MKHTLLVLTNALPFLCAGALLLSGGVVVADRSMASHTAEVRQIREQVEVLNARLRSLEGGHL